jgi:Protein of unknown function (DUF1249)
VFHAVRPPTAEELQALLSRIIRRIMQLLTRKSYLIEEQGMIHLLIPDPDMVIRIDTKAETVEALTFQDTYTYREVYPDRNRVDLKAKKELNEFLLQWLTNLIDQGHRLAPVDTTDNSPVTDGITKG